LAYVLTGISRFAELSANRGRFRAEGFSWEGPFVALAIGNGRQAGGGVPLCPDALLDDGLLDLMILPELDHAARLDAFSHLLREGRSRAVNRRAFPSASVVATVDFLNEAIGQVHHEPRTACTIPQCNAATIGSQD
jgi:diacylglycerol kinase family enzyme